jgi:16S rRNA (guanine966-N2)-methyltransferase
LRLVSPPGTDTRPTSDRVREATFNALGSYGALEGATVVDLFAGSGAMGIEALSRGAAHATFVERDRRALSSITQNLRDTGFDGQATVVAADALGFSGGASEPFDLAICDPPYAFDDWDALLSTLPSQLAVLESDRPLRPGPEWGVVRAKRYGSTVVTIVRRRDDRRDDYLETPQ